MAANSWRYCSAGHQRFGPRTLYCRQILTRQQRGQDITRFSGFSSAYLQFSKIKHGFRHGGR
jgi:hypothetical protein